ncbi:MAG TPA: cytochrome c [Rhodanobacter sp.]|jgi:mono/diheme cytochrome c family protein
MHDMYQQPKDKPQAPSTLFADGNSARTPPSDTVPMASGAEADSSGGRLGHVAPLAAPGPALPLDANGHSLVSGGSSYANPLPITKVLLARGAQRFNIYCAPCHGRSGDGAGMVVQRGFPAPPTYHSDRLRNAPDSHFFQVISDGYGVMYPYADRITSYDRWAIVAYIRALQLSQHATRDQLDAQDMARLATLPASPSSARSKR